MLSFTLYAVTALVTQFVYDGLWGEARRDFFGAFRVMGCVGLGVGALLTFSDRRLGAVVAGFGELALWVANTPVLAVAFMILVGGVTIHGWGLALALLPTVLLVFASLHTYAVAWDFHPERWAWLFSDYACNPSGPKIEKRIASGLAVLGVLVVWICLDQHPRL